MSWLSKLLFTLNSKVFSSKTKNASFSLYALVDDIQIKFCFVSNIYSLFLLKKCFHQDFFFETEFSLLNNHKKVYRSLYLEQQIWLCKLDFEIPALLYFEQGKLKTRNNKYIYMEFSHSIFSLCKIKLPNFLCRSPSQAMLPQH